MKDVSRLIGRRIDGRQVIPHPNATYQHRWGSRDEETKTRNEEMARQATTRSCKKEKERREKENYLQEPNKGHQQTIKHNLYKDVRAHHKK